MQYNVLNACVTVKEIISQEKYYRIKGNPIDMYVQCRYENIWT